MGNEITKSNQLDGDWNEIVRRLVAQLVESDPPEKVIKATEMLLAGYPIHKTARSLHVDKNTVERWLTAYPVMGAVVKQGKELLVKWRMARLEQQFLQAIDRSEEILSINLDGTDQSGERVDPKVLTVVAAQARYVIGLFAGQQTDIKVTHELGDTVVKAKQDALAYLADRLAEQQRRAVEGEAPIEVPFTIINPNIPNGPLLDEHGDPLFGTMGVLDRDDDGLLCHVCGRRFQYLSKHVLTAHNMGTAEYETMYILEPGILKKSEG